MPFTAYQPTAPADLAAERSYAFGQACGQVIELTLCGVEQHAPSTTARELCCIAEAIIEHMGGRPREVSWDDVTAGVRAASPRFRKAELAFEAERAVGGRAA